LVQTKASLIRENDGEQMSSGLAKLVLTLLETLRELMEKQARRRIEDKSLRAEEIERLGLAFMQLDQKIGEIARVFKLNRRELTLGLSPQSGLLSDGVQAGDDENFTTLADILDRVIEKGVVVLGEIGISVADIELIKVNLRLSVSGMKKKRKKKKCSHRRVLEPTKKPSGTRADKLSLAGRRANTMRRKTEEWEGQGGSIGEKTHPDSEAQTPSKIIFGDDAELIAPRSFVATRPVRRIN
jgi:hypothetical protein